MMKQFSLTEYSGLITCLGICQIILIFRCHLIKCCSSCLQTIDLAMHGALRIYQNQYELTVAGSWLADSTV